MNDNEPECEGHYDTDEALTSGAGIGQPVFCDGSCNPANQEPPIKALNGYDLYLLNRYGS